MENNVQNKKGNSFFNLVKANLLLMILITVLVTLIGALVGVLYVKPVYKASRSVILRTALQSSSTESEETNNAALAFLVIGQLQYHFTSADYINIANKEYQKIDSDAKDTISAGSIGIEYKEESLIITISYSDLDKDVAIDKLKAVYKASEIYFSEHATPYNIKLIPTDNAGTDDSRFKVTVDNGLTKFIFIGALAGVVLAVAVVFIKNALDNTLRDKEELEELTGANVLAYVEKRK